MLKVNHFSGNEVSVLCRVSFCACVILWSIVSWTTRILGQGNPPFVVCFAFFVFFLGLFYFSKKALRHFFLLLDSELFLKSVSKVRDVLPFNHKFILFMLTIHYVFVESRFHDWSLHFDYGLGYTVAHLYLMTVIFTISLIRSFVVIPSLILCSVVVESATVQTFLNSGKMNGPGQTRNYGTSGDVLLMTVKGPSVKTASLLGAPVLAAVGFVWVDGTENITNVSTRADELALQAKDHRKELESDRQKLVAQKSDLESQRETNLEEIAKSKGLFGSEKTLVQKQVEITKIDESLEKVAAQIKLNDLQDGEAKVLEDEFELVRKATENGNVTERGFAEILDKAFRRDRDVLEEGQIVTSVQLVKMGSKVASMSINHFNAQKALVSGKQASTLPSVLEFLFL